jgi:UDP-N-acetylmuramyl pentapeptide synthase
MQTHFLLTQEEGLRVAEYIAPGDVVLVKASRAEHLDELSEKILAMWERREVDPE